MARKKAAAQRVEETAEPVAAQPPATPQDATPSQAEPTDAPVDPFPRVVKSVVLSDTYRIRLLQNPATNEMRIQFGSGQRGDKPSDTVLDIIRSQAVPEELMTNKERAEGKPVPWFKFRSDPDTGEGNWRMWLRNHPLAARTKAEEIFEAVVDQVSQERQAQRVRQH
jgi:hypothetical protein